jgi:hypothetical protein
MHAFLVIWKFGNTIDDAFLNIMPNIGPIEIPFQYL